jgi:serine protease Do
MRHGLKGSRNRRWVAVAATFVAAGTTVLASSAQAARPQTTPLERVRALVQPSVVYLQIEWSAPVRDVNVRGGALEFNNGEPFTVSFQCTGFVVNPSGYIATAGHCVEFDDSVKAALFEQAAAWAAENQPYSGQQFSFEQIMEFAPNDFRLGKRERNVAVAYGAATAGIRTGRALPALVPGLITFDKGDVALLKIEAEDLPALKLAPDANVEVGKSIVSIGYPASVDLVTDETFDPSFKDGSISSKKTIGGGLVQVYEISAAVSGGMSGGPTVDLQGNVIGVNSFGITGEPQAFNFISPAAIVTRLMNDKGVKNELGPVSTAYRAGLQAYFAGERDEAIENFDAVLAQVPSHELAQEFKRKATALPEEESGLPLGIIGVIGGAVVGAMLLMGLVLLLMRGRRATAAAPPAGAPAGYAQPPAPPPPQPQPQQQAWAGAPTPPAVATAGGPTRAFVVRDGPLAGTRIDVDRDRIVGRESDDVILADPEASRRHAMFRPGDGGIEVHDLGSRNGTVVNGTRIQTPVLLSDGDVVTIGKTSLAAEVRAQPASAATVVQASVPPPGPG